MDCGRVPVVVIHQGIDHHLALIERQSGYTEMKFTYQPETRPLEGYTIKRAIDRGGFGEVYYALTDAGKEVALKLLQNNREVELRGVAQCLNLKHPNLVTLFDVKTDADGEHWVVMEYVAGQSLAKVIAAHPHGMPIEQVRHWVHGISQGLAFLHSRGLVHRDVKPGNIFLDQSVVKIGDVGLSKFVNPSHRSAHTESVGTVYYMAPEVAHGRYGCQVDVYGLGVILYEMLTGRVPFDGETTGEILMKHLSQSPDLTPIPPALRPVVAHALHKDPTLRTRSAGELFQELERALGGKPVAEDIPAHAFMETPRTGQRPMDQTIPAPTSPVFLEDPAPRTTPPAQPGLPPMSGWHAMLITLAVPAVFFAVMTMRGGRMMGFLVVLYCIIFGMIFLITRFLSSTARSYSPAPAGPVPGARPHGGVAQGHQARGHHGPRVHHAQAPARKPRAANLTPKAYRWVSLRQRTADASMGLARAAAWTVLFTWLITQVTTLLNADADPLSDSGRVMLFGLTTLVSAWGLISISKFFEGSQTDGNLLRLAQLGLGAGVGAFAWWLDQSLLIEFPRDAMAHSPMIETVGRATLVAHGNQPSLLSYQLFFGALFGLRKWWWLADSFRGQWFSLSSVVLTALLGWMLPNIWAFPSTWAVLWAATLACVVQLSAGWTPPGARVVITEEPAPLAA